MKKVYVGDILKACPDEMALKLVAGKKGLRKTPLLPEVQKVGALTGRFGDIDPRKVQVMGRAGVSYLNKLTKRKRTEVISGLMKAAPAAVVLAGGALPPDGMAEESDKAGVPLIVSGRDQSGTAAWIAKAVQEQAERETHVHGVLVDILGVGVLITGPSGIGKSECALELVVRGHRLVADDVVVVKKTPGGKLIGSGPEIIKYLVEVRGLGIVNVRDLFGISAIKTKKAVDLVVELVLWDEKESYDRLGIDEHTYTVAGVSLPYMRMPVTPGRNIAIIVEVAARNHALKSQGANAALFLERRLARRLAAGAGEGT